ncbi:hypothetical protein HanRHA438_Chr17g0789211 [Helianthus annuus]|nr:hypothetical protein HanIR_Chr17g0845611 [Helianthus annuus]KAJ0824134.1 hypothetical protein HanRHA438_Chr17g0789211 [Helianthus annuus]
MAPHRPFKMEKLVTFANMNPSVPLASSSSPSRPRNKVVMAILANHVKFITTSGNAIACCAFSSDNTISIYLLNL